MSDYELPISTEEMLIRTGYSRQKIHDLKKGHNFPKALSRNKWIWSDIVAWQRAEKAARNPVDVDMKRRQLDREADLVLLDHLLARVSEVRQRLAI